MSTLPTVAKPRELTRWAVYPAGLFTVVFFVLPLIAIIERLEGLLEVGIRGSRIVGGLSRGRFVSVWHERRWRRNQAQRRVRSAMALQETTHATYRPSLLR